LTFGSTVCARPDCPRNDRNALSCDYPRFGYRPLDAYVQIVFRRAAERALDRLPAARLDLIAQIETKKKQGSVKTLDRLARALCIPIEALIAEQG
jgi:hypothetical protein